MAGPAGTAMTLRYTRHADNGVTLHAVGIHFFHAGRKHVMATKRLQLSCVGLQRAGIGVQIFGAGKLQWVDENRGHHNIGNLPGSLHQAQVAWVQVAHGGDDSDLSALLALQVQGMTEVGNGVPGLHLTVLRHQSKQCSGAGNAPLFTASAYSRIACAMSLSDSVRKFFTNLGRSGEMPSRSCSTSTWPVV